MKTIINIFLLTCLLISYSCSNSGEIVVTGSDGKEYRSYRTACDYGDFNAAYDYVEKMEERLSKMEDPGEKMIYKFEIDGAKEYINRKEILYLVSTGKETDADRIFFLYINQNWNYGSPFPEIYKLAISCNNFYVLKKFLPIVGSETQVEIKEILDKNNIDY